MDASELRTQNAVRSRKQTQTDIKAGNVVRSGTPKPGTVNKTGPKAVYSYSLDKKAVDFLIIPLCNLR